MSLATRISGVLRITGACVRRTRVYALTRQRRTRADPEATASADPLTRARGSGPTASAYAPAGHLRVARAERRGPTMCQMGKSGVQLRCKGPAIVSGNSSRANRLRSLRTSGPWCRCPTASRQSRRSTRLSGRRRSTTKCRRRRAGSWVSGRRAIRRSSGGVRNGGQGGSEASASPVAYGLSGGMATVADGDAAGREDRRAVGDWIRGRRRLVRTPSTLDPAPWPWREQRRSGSAGRDLSSLSRGCPGQT